MKFFYFTDMKRCLLKIPLVLFFASCGFFDDSSSGNKLESVFLEDSLPGMIRVAANGQEVLLGTDEATAKANERPQMEVRFDYDFSMSRSEVTCGEFNSMMAPTTGLLLQCASDNIPATDLTYYDAVLYANARSKAGGFDTVYSYIQASFDVDKHCTGLEGLAYHPEIDGFRLPTEAEWTFAASINWDVDFSWNAGNSGFVLHEVCSVASDDFAFCDMAGNAMEWVNDWLGRFRDTTLSNYVGPSDGNALGERVVKGGGFRTEVAAMNSFSRGDVYTVTSSTRADYVGFRLAFGKIPNATWMGAGGNVTKSRLLLLINSSSIRSRMGSFHTKIAFRNDVTGNLAFVDFSSGILAVTEIVDTLDVYHPDISPDGKKVAFCTKPEGLSGKSALYVRDLNVDGTNLVMLGVESAAIPRWRVLENGDTAIVYVTDAGNNADETAFKSASTWQVKFANGGFGVPEKLFDGAYHGGVSKDNLFAVTGARILRANILGQDIVWYNGEQACNASLAKDGSKRTLFLDFGGTTGRAFAEDDYGVHARILVVDSNGTLIQSVAAPEGYSFDHSEWVDGENNFVVATLTNPNGTHEKIVLVNLVDGSITDLVEGDELWHPALWVQQENVVTSVLLDPDSAGVYMNVTDDPAAAILRYKLELLWTYRDWANVIVLGSSRPQGAIISNDLPELFRTLNLANVPNMMTVSDFFARNYVFPHIKNLKYLVVSLDIDLWHKDELSEYNFFYKNYKKYPGFVYDENHDFWKNGYPEGLAEMTKYSMGMEYYQNNFIPSRGYDYADPGTWEEFPAVEFDSTWMDSYSEYFYAALSHLENILNMAENRGVYVIGVVFPQSPNYRKTGSFGRYGIRRSEAPRLLKEIENLKSVYPHFVFWDENKMGLHDYADSMASNRDHLSVYGARQFTARLNILLDSLEGIERP